MNRKKENLLDITLLLPILIITSISLVFIYSSSNVISYADYAKLKGEQKAKELGKMRLEGKDYILKDGDIMHFRFNV